MNQTDLIKEFVNGATEGQVGDAKIVGDRFYHFDTPIIERYKKQFIFNESKYTDVTRFLQKKILALIPETKLIKVDKVKMNYNKSLQDYLIKK